MEIWWCKEYILYCNLLIKTQIVINVYITWLINQPNLWQARSYVIPITQCMSPTFKYVRPGINHFDFLLSTALGKATD
jgi:hypothetical protein